MLNIGKPPTFNEEKLTIEVHIFDFSKQIYNKKISVQIITRLRDGKNINDMDDLKHQLINDEKDCRKIFKI